MKDEAYRLSKEIDAVRLLREQYKDALGDDADLIADTIEGETSLNEKITALIETVSDDQALLTGIKDQEARLQDRKSRIARRIDLKKALIQTALEVSERKSIETPIGTATVKTVPVSVVIVEEADIPTQFYKERDPALDKRGLLAALKDSDDPIPGVRLSEPKSTLQIRW